MSIAGAIGNQAYVDPAQKRSNELDLKIKDHAAKVDLLRNADTQYWSFQAQSSLVFGLTAATNNAPDAKENLTNVQRLSTVNRRAAMTPIIGSLALAGEIPYRQTSDRMEALAQAEQADFTWDNYKAANDFELTLIKKGEQQMYALQTEAKQLTQQKADADALVDQRKLALITVLTLGSTFLLFANLISTRGLSRTSAEADHHASSI